MRRTSTVCAPRSRRLSPRPTRVDRRQRRPRPDDAPTRSAHTRGVLDDRHRHQLSDQGGRDRFRSPVRDDRRAHQPDRAQAARGRDEGRRLQPGRGRRARPGRGGRHMLDVNAGIPLADEPALLARRSNSCSRSPTCRCRSTPRSSRRSRPASRSYSGQAADQLGHRRGRALERSCRSSQKYGAAVVAISNDETGISEDPDVRFEVAKKIVERAADSRHPRADVVVDPLVMPIGAIGQAGQQVFTLRPPAARRTRGQHDLRRLERQLRAAEPQRITGTFLSMAIGAGMTSAIMNPLHDEVRNAVMAADVLAGHDQDCASWIAGQREAATAAAAPSRRRPRRRGGRRPASRLTRCVTGSARSPGGVRAVGASRRVADGTSVLDAARSSAPTSTRRAAAAGLCGRCQVVPSIGSFPKWQIDSTADRSPAGRRSRTSTPGAADRRRPTARLRGARVAATSSSRSRRPARSTARSCASRSTSATSRSTRSSGCTTSSCRPPSSAPTSAGCASRSSTRSRATSTSARRHRAERAAAARRRGRGRAP